MARTYFGTDGIRGLVGRSPITPDFALRLAHAVGRVLRRKEARPMVLIGRTRGSRATCWRARWSPGSTLPAWT